uniref:KIB1-4 beta-propeller domain-containing protein n=1 Tax=Arundo donax TaxID=35708 RepID=A0A0A9CJN7_ARUDO
MHLTPQFSMQQVAIMWEFLHINPCLVVCGDMLLMVDLKVIELNGSYSSIFEIFHLDFSVQPAKWVKMEKLENQALFVSLDKWNPSFSCMSPERWGGKSSCIYVAKLFEYHDETWTAVELGQPVQKSTIHCMYCWFFHSHRTITR